jgi:membrane-associated phospholipid phosphatase
MLGLRNHSLLGVLFVLLLSAALQLIAQTDSLPDAPSASAPKRQISWKLLLPNVVHDQKPIWLFPQALAEGKHLKPTLVLLSVTAGLVALDPIVTPYFRSNQSFSAFNKDFSGENTTLAMLAFPVAFYVSGLERKDTYAQHTALLAGEAVIDSEILTTVLKDVDRRTLPGQVPANSGFGDTWFEGHGQWYRGVGSFPSGHTIAAFSLATVFADRYPKPRWHRWVAFGLAGLVGFSRLPLQAHYSSDVFAGAVLGYSIAHYAVLRLP